MTTTSVTLLGQLCRPERSDDAWKQFEFLYRPYIRRWLARVPGLESESDDLAQEVVITVLQKLPTFQRQRAGAFRAWLRTVTVNKALEFARKRRPQPVGGMLSDGETFLSQLEDPKSHLSQQWDEEHDLFVLKQLMTIIRRDFDAKTWQAFLLRVQGGKSVAEVADELQMTPNAVMLAKSRVLRRLHDERKEFLE